MKVFLLALAVFAAVASGSPREGIARQGRFIEGIVIDAVNGASQSIQEAGLDPLEIDEEISFQFPVTNLLDIEAGITEFVLTGLSDIRVNNIDFSILASRVRYDIALPNIALRVGSAGGTVSLAGNPRSASVSGSLEIVNIRVTGEVRVNIGIISGISIRSLTVDFTLGGVNSALNINVLDWDLTEFTNDFLGNAIPSFVADNRSDINAVLAHYLYEIASQALESE